MIKKLIIILSVLSIGAIGFFNLNKVYKMIDLTSLSIKTDENLQKNKLKIEQGFFSINRVNDSELFDPNKKTRVIYNGNNTGLLETDYGENDFLITYDEKYYFQFRHFIFNSNHQHSYNLYFYKVKDTLYIQADIKGPDAMRFKRPMHLISDSHNLSCNVEIDSSKVMYNMIELDKK